MNGYDLTAQWFAYVDEHPEWVDTNVTALYFAIIQRSNELRWKTKFQLPALDTMQRIGIRSPKTYYPALNKLVEAGFISILEAAKNQFTACIIQLNAEVIAEVIITEATTEAGDQQLPRQGNGNCLGTGNKRKQENKETSKQENNNTPDSFETFWDTYDKKEDRKKCFDKWQKLSEDIRRRILEHVPAYVENKPDPTFRKNPLTYLNGEVWKDPLVASAKVVPLNTSSPALKEMVY